MTLRDLFDQHDAEDAAREAEIERGRVERNSLAAQLDASLAREKASEATIATLRARIAELEAGVPTSTAYGACPMKPGGESLAAARTVTTKWGQGAAVRQFKTDLSSPSTGPEFGIVHTSYKPSVSAILSGSLDAQIRAVAMATPAGHVLEVWHEVDKKVRDGIDTKANLIAAKNRFYDVVKSVRPDVLIANTLTGWELSPTNTTTRGNIDQWAAVKADILGVDLDGIRPTTLPYTDYRDEVNVALAFVDRFPGYTGWAVPEFGCPRVAADPDGIERAAWLTSYGRLFAAEGAAYVTLYEYDSSAGYALTTAAEIAAWKALA
jgi:hypothetical protein